MVELSDLVEPGPLQLFLVILASGGILGTIIGATYEYIRDWFTKRREEYVEISRYKIETISIVKAKYIQLGIYFNALYDHFEDRDNNKIEKFDFELCFYYVCNILSIRKAIRSEIGMIQLGSRAAEIVVNDLSYKLIESIECYKDLGPNSTYKMIELVSNNKEYEDFLITIHKENVYLKFVDWLTKLASNKLSTKDTNKEDCYRTNREDTNKENHYQTVKNSCGCFGYLLNFELNNIYKIWYDGKEPDFEASLPESIRKYLKEKYRSYYNHIYLSGKTRMYKISTKLFIIIGAIMLAIGFIGAISFGSIVVEEASLQELNPTTQRPERMLFGILSPLLAEMLFMVIGVIAFSFLVLGGAIHQESKQ